MFILFSSLCVHFIKINLDIWKNPHTQRAREMGRSIMLIRKNPLDDVFVSFAVTKKNWIFHRHLNSAIAWLEAIPFIIIFYPRSNAILKQILKMQLSPVDCLFPLCIYIQFQPFILNCNCWKCFLFFIYKTRQYFML